MFSPNVLDLLMPDPDNLLYGQIVKQLRPNWQFLSEKTMFPGFIYIVFTLIGIFSLKKLKNKFFLTAFLCMLIFLLLSLGPELKIYKFNLQVPTLYDVVKKIYFPLEGIRALGRVYSIVYLFMFPIFYLGLVNIKRKFKNTKIQTTILIFIICLILFENINLTISSNFILNSKDISLKSYLDTENKGDVYLIIPDTNNIQSINKEIPFFDINIYNQILFRNFRIVNGYSGYTPTGLASIEKYIITNGLTVDLIQALKKIGINKIALSKYQTSPEIRDEIIVDINNLKRLNQV
jgi:hypothetical protein